MAKTGLFGSFSLKGGGGGPLFPNVYVRIPTKSEHFCKNQKCSLGPKTQNKLYNFFLTGSLSWEINPSVLHLLLPCQHCLLLLPHISFCLGSTIGQSPKRYVFLKTSRRDGIDNPGSSCRATYTLQPCLCAISSPPLHQPLLGT